MAKNLWVVDDEKNSTIEDIVLSKHRTTLKLLESSSLGQYQKILLIKKMDKLRKRVISKQNVPSCVLSGSKERMTKGKDDVRINLPQKVYNRSKCKNYSAVSFSEVTNMGKTNEKFTIKKLFSLLASPSFETAKKAWKNKIDTIVGSFLMAALDLFNKTDITFFIILLLAWWGSQLESFTKKTKTEFSGSEGFIKVGGYIGVAILGYIFNILTKNAVTMTFFSITITAKDVILYGAILKLIRIFINSLENLGVRVPGVIKGYDKLFTTILKKSADKLKELANKNE